MIYFIDSKHSTKEVPVSLLEQCGLHASGQAQLSQESYEMVNKLGFAVYYPITKKMLPYFELYSWDLEYYFMNNVKILHMNN